MRGRVKQIIVRLEGMESARAVIVCGDIVELQEVLLDVIEGKNFGAAGDIIKLEVYREGEGEPCE